MWSVWFVKIHGTNSDRAESWINQLRLVVPLSEP